MLISLASTGNSAQKKTRLMRSNSPGQGSQAPPRKVLQPTTLQANSSQSKAIQIINNSNISMTSNKNVP